MISPYPGFGILITSTVDAVAAPIRDPFLSLSHMSGGTERTHCAMASECRGLPQSQHEKFIYRMKKYVDSHVFPWHPLFIETTKGK